MILGWAYNVVPLDIIALLAPLHSFLGCFPGQVIVRRQALENQPDVEHPQRHDTGQQRSIQGQRHTTKSDEVPTASSFKILRRGFHAQDHREKDQCGDTEQEKHGSHSKDHDEERRVVVGAYTCVEPRAMVIERLDALVAFPTVLRLHLHKLLAISAKQRVLIFFCLSRICWVHMASPKRSAKQHHPHGQQYASPNHQLRLHHERCEAK
mmetsp:Transcript_87436/g.227036  ORF Transcript_87436/g.227036 Transcript_87436/m.227036 type:complete len:209 (-) Transcript_87436:81-707(-)